MTSEQRTSNPLLRGRWKVWRDRFQKVKGISVVHRASDVGLELHTIGMTDEVAREELCVELMERLNGTRPADETTPVRNSALGPCVDKHGNRRDEPLHAVARDAVGEYCYRCGERLTVNGEVAR